MKMEKSSKPEESKSRRKSSKPVRNWRAIGMAVENARPETECIDEGSHTMHDSYLIDNCEPANVGAKKPIVFAKVDIELLHKASENYTEPNEPITIPMSAPKFPNNAYIGLSTSSDDHATALLAQTFIERERAAKLPLSQPTPPVVMTTNTPSSYVPPACSTRLPISVTRQDLEALREKSVAIKTCMTMTMEEIECLIRGNMVVKVSNRKKPDQSLKYPCKFCIWFNHETNGQVRLRSFGRKEEIKRHHMLHLRYERFQCQYCPYKVVRSDHLHRHMKNKHPEVNHPGPQSNRRKKRDDQLEGPYGLNSEFHHEGGMEGQFGQSIAPQGLSALLSQNGTQSPALAALGSNALSQLIQAGLLNTQSASGTSLNLFGGASRFNFPMSSQDEIIDDDEDDDGPLVIACEDESDDSVEEIETSPPTLINPLIKASPSPLQPHISMNRSFMPKFNTSNTDGSSPHPQMQFNNQNYF